MMKSKSNMDIIYRDQFGGAVSGDDESEEIKIF